MPDDTPPHTDDDALSFEVPTYQKVFSAGLAGLLAAAGSGALAFGGVVVYAGWFLLVVAGFFASQAVIYLVRPEVCRIEGDTLIAQIGPFGSRRVPLADITDVDADGPYLTLQARDDDGDGTRTITVATNVLSTADRNRLIRKLNS
jgi:hypothetical protein